MAATLCLRLRLPKQGWLLTNQSVRHGSKAVTRHRRPLHILKQKLLSVTEYIPPPRGPAPGAYPKETQHTVQEDSGLMVLMMRSLRKTFEESRMVGVAHNSSSSAQDMMMLKHRLHRHAISVKFFPNQVVRSFLMGGAYSNMAPLFIGPTILLVSDQPKAKEMLSALRASPQITLLGACIDHTLLSAQGVLSYSKLPSVTVVQGELVSGLTVMTSRTASMLGHHPARLSALLQQYVDQNQQEVP
ncbi:large ribosomal subunit protein uL10m [Gouania willdenowi]|uniref:Large ribosomal subunit protein uL10m n=1 Tax=Gouania willdenowi TaxID=441366 RepID=A0A8C5HQ96_GOUWI|nr:39S ribosomal protein L10, mitochondrial [Gouania willdenowi]